MPSSPAPGYLTDVAYLRTYKIDYVNMSRVADTNVSVATEIGSTGRGASTGGGTGGSGGTAAGGAMTGGEGIGAGGSADPRTGA